MLAYGLVAPTSRDRRALAGDDVEIDIDAVDEINTRIRPAKIVERFRRRGNFGVVFMVGVQGNQFPRALRTLPARRAPPALRW